MTIPAIAPPLRPEFVTEAPTRLLPSVETGVVKASVVVTDAVEVAVTVVAEVPRAAAPSEDVVAILAQ